MFRGCKGNGAVIENGEGKLIDPHTVEVGGKKITAANVIIATGSQAKSLPIEISPEATVLTSTEMLDIDEAPESMVVIGGGVIGIEFAYF
ncbi:MAG: FAD-dependent oxidoreductase, partial [Clostridia bacterium]